MRDRVYSLWIVVAALLVLGACAPTVAGIPVDPTATKSSPTAEAGTTAARFATGLSATLEAPTRLPDSNTVIVQFTLTNNSDVALYVLKWYTPLEGIGGEIFSVERDGQAVPYTGILAMRGDPTPEAYQLLEAGQSASAKVDLATSFDFSQPGEYIIEFLSPRISHVARSEAEMARSVDDLGPVDIPANTVTVEIGGSSVEPTAVPTDSPQPTPTSTAKPASRPSTTPDEPQILSFTASPDPVEREGTVTLTWNMSCMTGASITRLSPTGDIFLETEARDLPARGSVALKVPDEYTEAVKYYLGARDANGVLYRAYVTVGIICRYDEYMAPRCPLTQDAIWTAYEPFERGHMVWRSDTRQIYVLYNDGSYEIYEDTWHEGDPIETPGSPPSGFYAPVRGFGNLYAAQPDLRERLGWATAPEEGFTMRVETVRGGSGRYPGTSVFFTLPNNGKVNLYPFTSTWKILP